MQNTKWVILCIIGGILMILGSTIGSIAFFETIFGLLSGFLSQSLINIIEIVLQVLSYIASGGGISVIIGAILVGIGVYRLGKIIIAIGAGMGLIGFIIFLIVSILNGSVVNEINGIILEIINGGYGFIGVLITIVARSGMDDENEDED
ncbi:MAG: hypothetical protein ACXAES_05500 [Promethearchaeota archaeon]|jgi:hypothetical protein